VELARQSAYYETAPVEYHNQPDFLNCAVELDTSMTPLELLNRIQEIEQQINDEKRIPKGPRKVDLDILLFDGHELETGPLTIPHPAICERRFVLVPLLEIAPDQICPRHQRPYRKCLELLDDPLQKVMKYNG
jgi:2-amino-4-hydroxy-6-hydroxymethyldihydropteridine diphosphokinase